MPKFAGSSQTTLMTMGNGSMSKSEAQINREIEKQILLDQKRLQKELKILLLGGSESGKSTFAKQMKILHMNGFSDNDRRFFKQLIFSNVLENLAMLLSAMHERNIGSNDSQLQKDIDAFHCNYSAGVNVEIQQSSGLVIQSIWANTHVQEAYARRNEFYIPDSTKYFLDSIERISAANYSPSNEDMLRARIATTGIVEIEFPYKNLRLTVIDVGGQRAQRRKWIHCFDNVTAIMFITALSDYDLKLTEDTSVNRIVDSLELFRSITHSEYFKKTPIILFLNKKDIFLEKIANVPIQVCFPEYAGQGDYESTSTFIKEKFRSKAPKGKDVYPHITVATDTGNINHVFDSSMDIIIQANMARAGLS